MQVRLFGEIEVLTDDGSAVVIGAAKVRQLVAALAAEPGRVRSLGSIVDCLWGDEPPSTAANLVQGYVSDLRRALGADAVVRRGAGYLLAVGTDDVDLARFERLLADGRRLAAVDPGGAMRLFDECLALARGSLLDDVPAFGALAAIVVRTDAAVIEVEELRIDAGLAAGLHHGLVPRLEWLVKVHPLREAFWAQLALVLYRSGRQAEALRRCQEIRVLLRDEIGVTPGALLLDIEQRIARQDPSLDLAPSSQAPAPVDGHADAATTATVVGRRTEMERLKDRLRRATNGGQHLILLGGEPGIGKSTLAAELGRRAALGGAVVLVGRCDEQINAPYLPFVGALSDHLLALTEADADHIIDGRHAHVHEVLPSLSIHRGVRPRAQDATGPSMLERFETLAWLLQRVRRGSTLLLVLEDLQWADSTTIGLLSYLVSGSRLPATLVLATYRATEVMPDSRLADLLVTLRSNPQAERMLLGGLSVEDIGELVDADDHDDGTTLAAWIHEETGGNALFVRELLRHVQETGQRSGVPDGVADVVSRRVRRLSAPAQQLLARAAVLGNEFPVALLRAVNTDITGLGEVVGEVEQAGILEPVIGSGDADYRFCHATIRRAVSGLTGAVAREELHLQAADALATLGQSGESTLSIAAHLVAAGSAAPRERAFAAFVAAATYADGQWAKAEAVQWYDLALNLLPPEDERRRALRLTKFVAAQAAWHWHHDQPSIRAKSPV